MRNETTTTLNDGDKAAQVREALTTARRLLPDTAHGPRTALLKMSEQPSMVLAMIFDQLNQEG